MHTTWIDEAAKASPRPWKVVDYGSTYCFGDAWGVEDAKGEPVARYSEASLYPSCSILDGLSKEDATIIVHAVNTMFPHEEES